MAPAPKSPTEQSRFEDTGEASTAGASAADANLPSDRATEVHPSPSNDAAANPKPQDHYGSFKQNLTTQWRVEER